MKNIDTESNIKCNMVLFITLHRLLTTYIIIPNFNYHQTIAYFQSTTIIKHLINLFFFYQ